MDITKIKILRDLCKKKKCNFFLSNNVKLAMKLKLDGVYLPSFNKSFNHLTYNFKKKFIILGSAHSLQELNIKKLQAVKFFFISSLFKKNKNYLGIYKFKILRGLTKNKVIALGGISKINKKKIKLLACEGFAGISYFE